MVKDPADPVTVRLIQHGEMEVLVDPVDLAAALELLFKTGDGEDLDNLLLPDVAKNELDTAAVLPDGIMVELMRVLRRTIQPTLRRSPESALAAIIAASRTRLDCAACTTCGPCPQHLAEDIVVACRRERVLLLFDDGGAEQPLPAP